MTTTKQQQVTDRNNLHAARSALLAWQPEAIRIRLETEKCPSCKRGGGFVTYILPDDIKLPLRNGMESCGAFCRACEFTGSTIRPVEES